MLSWFKKRAAPIVEAAAANIVQPVAQHDSEDDKEQARARLRSILPSWASLRIGDDAIIVNADMAYPTLLRELGVSDIEFDQYWHEVAFQCIKLDVQNAVKGARFYPKGGMTRIFIDGDKNKWMQSRLQTNAAHPLEAATKGGEAREHYRRIRG